MDPDAYEFAESVADLFDSLDANGDEQVSLEEFLAGAKRHPELLDMFFHADEKKDGQTASPPNNRVLAAAAAVNHPKGEAGGELQGSA